MKCVAVSDIHMREVKTPDADLLLVAGDMTMTGSLPQMTWFENWLLKQPQKHKVWIAGNHEMGLEQNPLQAPRLAERTESIYLEDSGVDIDGISIWGSPVTPWFHDWAFNRQRGEEIRRHWQMIPEGTDILMVHGPPYGHLDYTIRGEHVGCNDLIEVLEYELEYPPQVVVFGHIHFAYGEELMTRPDGKQIKFINACSCDENYIAVNDPILFEI